MGWNADAYALDVMDGFWLHMEKSMHTTSGSLLAMVDVVGIRAVEEALKQSGTAPPSCALRESKQLPVWIFGNV